jgi:phosphatidylglycerophosphate synthase
MPPATTAALETATLAVILADGPQAEEVLLGLPHYLRGLLAAHHAGCSPLLLVVAADRAERIAAVVADEPRLPAPVEVLTPSAWEARRSSEPEAGRVVIPAGAVVDPQAVRGLATGEAAPPTYLGPELTRAQKRRGLLRTLGNPIDGLVDRYVNRTVSRQITALLTPTGISPNAVTVISTLIGLLGTAGVAAAGAGYYELGIAGALLFQLAAAFDCADGEIARLTYRFSPFGAKLDLGLDNVVYTAIFLALGAASVPALGAPLALGLGGLAVFGQLCSAVQIWRIWFHPRPGDEDPRLRGVLDRLTNRDFSLGVIALSLVSYWHLLLIPIAIGTQFFWVWIAIRAHQVKRVA